MTKETRISRTEHLWGGSPRQPVPNKRNFVERYKAGEFGNASPTWNRLEELYEHSANIWGEKLWKHPGPFHVRNRVAQGPTWYNVHLGDLELTWEIARARCGAENLYISAMAPHHLNIIQGEVWQMEEHLHLTYSDLPDLPMREALKTGLKYIEGLPATMLLKRSLCPNSWEWLNILLDSYRGHVVEFSTFGTEWGTVPGYNTVFWEVRNY